jgi:hypothetical protein
MLKAAGAGELMSEKHAKDVGEAISRGKKAPNNPAEIKAFYQEKRRKLDEGIQGVILRRLFGYSWFKR